jgi:hypothetical protein
VRFAEGLARPERALNDITVSNGFERADRTQGAFLRGKSRTTTC